VVVAQYLLTFREVLEAALLCAIILAFLVRTGRTNLVRYAWYGIYAAAVASVGLGAGILLAYGSLSDAQKVLFEGVAALVAVAVLTSMIYWMAVKGRTMKVEVEGRVEAAVTQGAIAGLISLTFVLVFREGLETVLFLTPFLVQDAGLTVLGAALGLGAGVGMAYAIFRVGIKLDLRRFFYFTSILLILLAGGLLGYGIHELIEYGEATGAYDAGWWATSAYNLGLFGGSATAPPDPLHHKGVIGSVFAVLLGYSSNPEWGRVVAHVSYLAVALPVVFAVYRRPDFVARFVARLRPSSRVAPATQKETLRSP
jgi:high-affinity iron transporter